MTNFNQVIDRTNTYCTQWDFIKDRFGEENLLPFSISDMDFKAPTEILQACTECVEHGVFGYSRWNHHDYKSAISGYFQRRHHCTFAEDSICFSPSVLYSVSLLIRLLTKENDGILVMEPMYDAFYNVIQSNNRRIVKTHLKKDDNSIYQIDFDDFEMKAKTASLFLLCSPHNPTGRVWNENEMGKMLKICKENNLQIISDEIHSDIVFGVEHHSVLKYLQEYTNIYLVSSPSKTFNIPSLGGSYAVIPKDEVYQRFVNHLRTRDFVNSPPIMHVRATIEAYTKCDYYIEELKNYVYENMQLVKNFADATKGVNFVPPQATYLAWIDVCGLGRSDAEIQNILVHEGKVGVMSGTVYGEEGYLRMNCGCSRSKMIKGLQKIQKCLGNL